MIETLHGLILFNRYEIFFMAKVHKKSDFLRPVYKKVKTVTIFVGKKRSAGFPSLIER